MNPQFILVVFGSSLALSDKEHFGYRVLRSFTLVSFKDQRIVQSVLIPYGIKAQGAPELAGRMGGAATVGVPVSIADSVFHGYQSTMDVVILESSSR